MMLGKFLDLSKLYFLCLEEIKSHSRVKYSAVANTTCIMSQSQNESSTVPQMFTTLQMAFKIKV